MQLSDFARRCSAAESFRAGVGASAVGRSVKPAAARVARYVAAAVMLAGLLTATHAAHAAEGSVEWPLYGGAVDEARYSTLSRINTANQ